jgi:AcrR family transcriptional regulator
MAAPRSAPSAEQPPVLSRVERKRNQRILEILTATAELVGEHGYDAVTLDDVAERLDVTKGSLYHYFSSKEALVSAAIETLGVGMTARMEATAAALEGSATERLRGLLRAQADMVVRTDPGAIRLFMLGRSWPEPQRSRIKELRRRHNAMFRDLLEEGVRTGEFSVTDVDVTLQCMHAAINNAPRWLAVLPKRKADRALETMIDTLMLLVRADRASAGPAAE